MTYDIAYIDELEEIPEEYLEWERRKLDASGWFQADRGWSQQGMKYNVKKHKDRKQLRLLKKYLMNIGGIKKERSLILKDEEDYDYQEELNHEIEVMDKHASGLRQWRLKFKRSNTRYGGLVTCQEQEEIEKMIYKILGIIHKRIDDHKIEIEDGKEDEGLG